MMNTANLQLEGLCMAIAAINNTLVRKKLIEREEIELALQRVEAVAMAEDRAVEDLSPAHRDAIAFPIRLLRLANAEGSQPGPASFADLARRVGETKGRYNDQE